MANWQRRLTPPGIRWLGGVQVLKKDPLFHGDDNYDQLVKISRILGTDDLLIFVEVSNGT